MKLKYTFLGFLLFLGLLFIPRNVNAKDNEVNNKIVGNIERENNKTAKYITLENVKKHLEKVGEEELFEQAKLEIENRYKSNSLIRVMGTGGSSYGPGEHSTRVVYMGESGITHHLVPWQNCPFVDVKDKDSLVIFSK